MKKYNAPSIEVTQIDYKESILAESDKTITSGGSNAGQNNPTAESKSIDWSNDDDEDIW